MKPISHGLHSLICMHSFQCHRVTPLLFFFYLFNSIFILSYLCTNFMKQCRKFRVCKAVLVQRRLPQDNSWEKNKAQKMISIYPKQEQIKGAQGIISILYESITFRMCKEDYLKDTSWQGSAFHATHKRINNTLWVYHIQKGSLLHITTFMQHKMYAFIYVVVMVNTNCKPHTLPFNSFCTPFFFFFLHPSFFVCYCFVSFLFFFLYSSFLPLFFFSSFSFCFHFILFVLFV